MKPLSDAPEARKASELLETKPKSEALEGVELVSAFCELASSSLHNSGLLEDPSLFTLARRELAGKLTGNKSENKLLLAYSDGPEKKQDREWHQDLTDMDGLYTGNRVDEVGAHLLEVLANPVHPLGRCVAKMVEATINIFKSGDQRREEAPQQLLSDLAFEVAHFSTELATLITRVFPELSQDEQLIEQTRLCVDTVVYLRLYQPVLEVLQTVHAVEDTQCERQMELIGGCGADPNKFRVRKDLQLPYEHYDAVHALMANFSGIQVPLQKAKKLKQVCSELARIITTQTGRPPGADELLPLFVYVVACSQVPKFMSQVRFMELFLVDDCSYEADEETYYIALARSASDFFLQQ